MHGNSRNWSRSWLPTCTFTGSRWRKAVSRRYGSFRSFAPSRRSTSWRRLRSSTPAGCCPRNRRVGLLLAVTSSCCRGTRACLLFQALVLTAEEQVLNVAERLDIIELVSTLRECGHLDGTAWWCSTSRNVVAGPCTHVAALS